MVNSRGVRLDPPQVIVQAKTEDLLTADSVTHIYPGAVAEPLYDSQQLASIRALVRRAQTLSPGYRPPRFADAYRVLLPKRALWSGSAPRRNIAAKVRQHMFDQLPVDRVSVETLLAPLPVSDGVAPGAKDLQHLDPADAGVGAESVWGMPGGRGQGEVLADVERGWHTGHIEFKQPDVLFDTLPGGVWEDDWVPHGTEALATCLGRVNNVFGLGVAHEVAHVILSAEKRVDGCKHDTAAAILEALDKLSAHLPGSVLLLEVQKVVKDFDSSFKSGILGPVEMAWQVFDMIQLAVANHVVVVEAAGNGGTANASLGPGPTLALNQSPLAGDSGAIMVGQSQWGSDGHKAIEQGCTGNRIDCFSWGFEVYAGTATPNGTVPVLGEVPCPDPGADPNATAEATVFKDDGSSGFGGTSSASAIVAGAALVVQGLVRNGAAGALTYLPPMQMRALLGNRDPAINTTLSNGDAHVIGVQPNLKQIAVELGLLPDLYIRDNVGDMGGPHTGMLSRSPDIILRSTPLTSSTPDAAYGEPSNTKSNDDLSTDLVEGQTAAELFVRVQNRGGSDVTDALVSVYFSKPATLIEPVQWQPIGTALVDVPQGNTLAIAGPIAWTNLPTPGHYCLIATVGHAKDPLFVPDAFADIEAYKSHVRTENNVAWRNFNVVPANGSGTWSLAAGVFGAAHDDPAQEEEMELRVEARLPRGATVEVELPEQLLARMTSPEGAFEPGARTRLSTSSITSLGTARLRSRETHDVTLHVALPKACNARTARAARYEVALIQLHKGQALGRVTWQLAERPTKRAQL